MSTLVEDCKTLTLCSHMTAVCSSLHYTLLFVLSEPLLDCPLGVEELTQTKECSIHWRRSCVYEYVVQYAPKSTSKEWCYHRYLQR